MKMKSLRINPRLFPVSLFVLVAAQWPVQQPLPTSPSANHPNQCCQDSGRPCCDLIRNGCKQNLDANCDPPLCHCQWGYVANPYGLCQAGTSLTARCIDFGPFFCGESVACANCVGGCSDPKCLVFWAISPAGCDATDANISCMN